MTTETTIAQQPSDLDNIINATKSELNNIDNNKTKKRGRPNKNLEASPLVNVATRINPQEYEAGIKSLLIFTGMFLATGFKFEGFKLSDEEATMLAKQGAECVVEFSPQLNSKYVKLGAFTIALGGVFGMRAMAYSEYVKMLDNQKKVADNSKNEV